MMILQNVFLTVIVSYYAVANVMIRYSYNNIKTLKCIYHKIIFGDVKTILCVE